MKYHMHFLFALVSILACDHAKNKSLDKTSLVITIDSSEINTKDQDVIMFGGPEPTFPGDYQSLRKYIQKEFNCFPDTSNSTFGEKIIMRFTVEKNGQLSDIEVIQAKHKENYECYINLIKKMPNWIPACRKNECIKVTFTLPINLTYN